MKSTARSLLEKFWDAARRPPVTQFALAGQRMVAESSGAVDSDASEGRQLVSSLLANQQSGTYA